MMKQEDIDGFYRDVEALSLKFPVAAIAAATNQSKSNVSKYLNKKLEPSESFLKKFYEKFPKSDKKVSNETGKPESLESLITSNACLSRAQEKFADAHLILAKDHHELLAMFKKYVSSTETDEASHVSQEEERSDKTPVVKGGPLDKPKKRSAVKIPK